MTVRPEVAAQLAALLQEATESPELNFPEFSYENTAQWLVARGVSVGAALEAPPRFTPNWDAWAPTTTPAKELREAADRYRETGAVPRLRLAAEMLRDFLSAMTVPSQDELWLLCDMLTASMAAFDGAALEAVPLNPDGVCGPTGGNATPLSDIAKMAVDLGPPDLSATFRHRRGELAAGALNEDALDAAERAYWGDNGVSRHNLAAAIRVYLAARPPEEPLEPDLADLCDLCETDQWESQRQIRRADGVLVVFCVCPCCGDAYDGAAPLRGPSPRLPDTFVERAIRAAQVMVDPNDDTAVMLSAFEASAIRRGVSSPSPSSEVRSDVRSNPEKSPEVKAGE